MKRPRRNSAISGGENMALLEVNDLRKGFGKLSVLKGISFCLEQGQVLVILGSSGSGKTTLLRCLNFLETADSGEIRVNGSVLTGWNDFTNGATYLIPNGKKVTVAMVNVSTYIVVGNGNATVVSGS